MPFDRNVPMDLDLLAVTDELRARLDIGERMVPSAFGPDVRVVTYRPRDAHEPLPAVLHLHGGAFCLLRPEDFSYDDAATALAHRAMVVAVDYRLAPEHAFPAGLDDCYAVLQWMAASAADLAIDAERIVVTGASAGGALAAAVCLRARDTNGPHIAAQALRIPVLDDRLDSPSMRTYRKNDGFSGRAAEGMWLHYLGEDRDVSATSAYAAPARADSLAGLPPAIIVTHQHDPLRDEGILFAMRLLADGNPVELHNVPGAYHGAPPLDPAALRRSEQWFRAALGQALRPTEQADA
ncbi:MAG: alpha/beta hydrolase [Actinomycetota bacterium]|nr:alpha/beta hydrolase [Actinomycetota bacterium]